MKKVLLRYAERTVTELCASLLVKILVLIGYFGLLNYLSPFDLLSFTGGLVIALGIFLWFFEFQGEVLTVLVLALLPNRSKT